MGVKVSSRGRLRHLAPMAVKTVLIMSVVVEVHILLVSTTPGIIGQLCMTLMTSFCMTLGCDYWG